MQSKQDFNFQSCLHGKTISLRPIREIDKSKWLTLRR